MVGKLCRLPVETQTALQHLACLGNSAEITLLAVVLGTSEAQVHRALWERILLELVERREARYRFVHDRVQEAAYSLIPEPMRPEMHLRIGKLLVAHTPPEKREEVIFEIVNQLNRGSALIQSQDEREELAELNLIAGKRAKQSTAYDSALTYLAAGRALLPEDCWKRCGALTFALELHRAECEFLTGAFAAAEERLSMLSSRRGRLVDLAAVTWLREELFTTLARSDRAIEVCLDYLQHLGIRWSAHPAREEVEREYERIWRQIGSRSIEELVDLPLMADPEWRATMDVLTAVLPPALFTDENLLCLVICRMANLSLEHGNSDAACVAYVSLGMLLGPRFGNYRAGFSFGKLGLDLVDQRGLRRFESRVCVMFGGRVSPWTQPVRTGLSLVWRAFDAASRLGDLTYAGLTRNILIINLLFTGDPLGDVQREAEVGLDFARQFGFGHVIDYMTVNLGLIRTLRGLNLEFGSFNGTEFDEGQFEQRLANDPRLSTAARWYWICQLQARFFAGAYAQAVAAASNVRSLLSTPGSLEVAEYQVYAALVRAALCDTASVAERTQHQEALAAHHRQLQEWAENCPANFEGRAALIGAEIARIEGRTLDAEQLYEQAIRSARANGFVHNEAVANELAARFYAARGFETISDAYLRNARYCYLRWGADGKVRQLDQLYPQLGDEPPVASATSTIGTPVEHLDLATVVKLSQAVSGTIVLEKLLDKLMRTALEHAGAERGLLILSRGAEQRIAAEATAGSDTVTVQLSDEPVTAAVLPESVLHYVLRTQESVILDDAAAAENPFVADPYIRQRQARSILCLALINQGQLVGVLYLENNLTPRVFAPARIAALKLLASQAAISLENGRLYRDLAEREARIRQDERELRTIVDFLPELLVVGDAEGGLEYANRAALELTGRTLQETLGRPDVWSEIVHPDDLHTVQATIGGLAEGIRSEVEFRLRRADGQYRWMLGRSAPLRDAEGCVIGWFSTGTDIDDRKRAEQRMRDENLALREEVDKASMFEEIVGTSPALRALLTSVAQVAPTDSTVLITGETGTGKELVARAIHKRSQRASRAFVSVNCAAIPPTLIASELFGHEKGAFTGALERRAGRFELADGGTIFLDEVGDLPPDTQLALLRVLQEREFERVGSARPIKVDVRVIAATNRDLNAAIERGAFRTDLFYRLNVFPIEVPPLRERPSDIPLLMAYFVERYARNVGKTIRQVDKRTLELVQSYRWPGNVRELQNVIERAVIICESETLKVDPRWLARQTAPERARPLADELAARERQMIETALAESNGRVSGPTGAAARLGMPGSTLESKIRALGISKHRFKGS